MNISNSTYSLLVRSEEKSRALLEIVLFALVLLSSIASIWQFAEQRVVAPGSDRAAYVASAKTISHIRS